MSIFVTKSDEERITHNLLIILNNYLGITWDLEVCAFSFC